MYSSVSTFDKDLLLPSSRRVGKGGVCLLWHKKLNNLITPITCNNDRIIGIQLQCSEHNFVYVFQVYLPSTNHSISKYNDVVFHLENIVSQYIDKGIVIVMGDINIDISAKGNKYQNARCHTVLNLISEFNLIPVNLLDICSGFDHSNANYNGGTESMIDYIFLNADKSDLIESCCIPDDNALNVSSHRPILCKILIPNILPVDYSFKHTERVKWNRVKSNHISAYQNYFESNNDVLNMLSGDLLSENDIDSFYQGIVSVVKGATDKCIPKSKFKRCLKPYWNPELSLFQKEMKQQRWQWIENGRSRDPNNSFYMSYKQAKRKFRQLHRKCAANYLQKLNDDIDRAAELNSTDFWKLINSRKNKCNSSAGVELEFGGTVTVTVNKLLINGRDILKSYIPRQQMIFIP